MGQNVSDFQLSKAQLNAPRAEKLRSLWRKQAERALLAPEVTSRLQEPTVAWLLAHHIEHRENVVFIMIAIAKTEGRFLREESIYALMNEANGEYEMAVSILRNQSLHLQRK